MIYELKNLKSRAATAENKQAKVGAGGQANNGRKGSPCIESFKQGETHVLLDTNGPGMVRHIWFTIQPGNIQHMRNIIIRMYWDGQDHPSVEVPLGDFFGIAHGRQRNLVTEYVSMQDGKGFNCWIPMPFKSRARITVENDSGSEVPLFFYQIDFTLGDQVTEDMGYFHAQFRRSNPCPLHEDFVILDGVKGKGVYLGTVLGVRSLFSEGWWGEGEVKFFIDGDSQFPTICGTGTEDYMGSAWGLEEIVTPYQGAPLVDEDNGLYSIYRFHVKDPIYFQEGIKVSVQQIGFGLTEPAKKHFGEEFVNYRAAGIKDTKEMSLVERSDDYCSTAFWFQELPTQPFPPLPDRKQRGSDLLENQSNQEMKRSDI
ncbi:glycoside hydrolase family 172 protein [Lentibacillus sediminis]|uniref:glycoside hydrolase family 172 protein n=1 Tax=Lentibacillus sediminis TaxID=1940529 RepID=UPI000C1C187F|nr:glycoside hydrolase family 172 protein [Lentibacillus sediminis]